MGRAFFPPILVSLPPAVCLFVLLMSRDYSMSNTRLIAMLGGNLPIKASLGSIAILGDSFWIFNGRVVQKLLPDWLLVGETSVGTSPLTIKQ